MLTGIDFEDTPRTRVEADWYVGRQMSRGGRQRHRRTALRLVSRQAGAGAELRHRRAPDREASQGRSVGSPWKGLTGWEANVSGGGQEWHLKGGAAYAITPWLSVGGHAGRFFAASGADHDYSHWDIGATATWRRLSLDARYGGTNRPLSQCFFTDWCKPGAYASVSYRLYP